jgi:PilZ domain
VALHRLREGRPVVLDLAEEAIECTVAAVAGDEATLEPLSAVDAGYIPSLGRAAALVFGGDGERVRVRGAVWRGAREGSLRFVSGAETGLPARRRTPRVTAEVPVAVTAPAGGGEPGVHRLVMCDLSLGGVGVRVGPWAPEEGAVVEVAIELPAAPPIRGTARVLRVEDGVAGLEFADVSLTDRARLAAFLIASRAA